MIVEKPLAPTLEDAAAIAAAAARAGPSRDGGAELPLPAAVARAPRARSRPARSARCSGSASPAGATCATPGSRAATGAAGCRTRYLLDMAIHHVDMLRMITGARGGRGRRAQLGRARRAVPARSHGGGAAHARRRHAGLATRARGRSRSSQTSWNGDWELVGSRGARDLVGRCRRRAARDGPARPTSRAGPARGACPRCRPIDRLGVLAELRRAVAAGERPECSAADNLRSLAVIFALARSTEERRPRPCRGAARRVKIGLFLALYADLTLEQALAAAVGGGLRERRDRVERDEPALPPRRAPRRSGGARALRGSRPERGLELSALSCHGNPLHPDRRRRSRGRPCLS